MYCKNPEPKWKPSFFTAWQARRFSRSFPIGRSAVAAFAAVLLICAFIVPSAALPAAAISVSARHPISITEASLYVTRTKAIMRIQMFAEDLLLFQGLEPDDQDRVSAEDLRRGLEQHRAFLLERVTLRDADGLPIAGQVTDLKPFEIPTEGIVTSDLMKHSATYELEFSFTMPPEFLTIQQDISDENFIIPSEMKLIVHQAGTALNHTESLQPGASTTIRFDWQQALSEDASEAEWDSWFEKQREATLGITSYGSVYSFIYIEPTEVRFELLIPLATLKTILPVRHRDAAFVEVDEQDAARDLIRSWLKDENPVTINGTRIMPEFSRIDMYSLSLSDFAAQAVAQRVSMASGRVGIILRYRTPDDAVRDATFNWNKFYSTMNKVPAVVVAYPDSMDRFEFSRFNKAEDNTLTWACDPDALPRPVSAVTAVVSAKPTLTIPVGGVLALLLAAVCLRLKSAIVRWTIAGLLVLAAAVVWQPSAMTIQHPWQMLPELSPEEANRVFMSLHQGMYRSLDFGSEDRVYDVLAKTVDGDLLEDLYLQLRQSLEIRDQGGAIARIRSVSYDAGQAADRRESRADWPGFEYHSTWTVAGTVEHWGHVHERQNQFHAVFTVEPRDGNWKFTRMDIEGQQQKSARTTLRKF